MMARSSSSADTPDSRSGQGARFRGKGLKPRKKRADATPEAVIASIRAMRRGGALIREIMAAHCVSKDTVLNYVRSIKPPDASVSWQSYSAVGGQPVRPSVIVDCGDGTATVELNHGLHAIIDATNIPLVAGHRWFAHRHERKAGPAFYARAQNQAIGAKFMHNLILPTSDGEVVDHINRNGLDNRRCNLRPASPNGNAVNKTHNGSLSGFIGVTFYKPTRRWNAHVMWQGKNHSGGYFRDPVDAALARDALARRLQGEFAVLNFPEASE